MDSLSSQIVQQLVQANITTIIALFAMAVAWQRGVFKAGVLVNAPLRHVELKLTDLLCILSLMFAGMVIAGSVAAGQDSPVFTKAARLVPVMLAMYTLALAYLFYRLTHQSQDQDQPPTAGRIGVYRFGLGSFKPRYLKSAILALLLALPVVFAANSLGELVGMLMGHELPKTGHEILELLSQTDHKTALLFLLSLSVVFIAPIAEEIIYRGVMQTFLVRLLGPRRRWLVLIISGSLFASVHIASVPIEVIPSLFVLGVILGWLYETTTSLWPCMIVHALFNAINLSLATLLS